TNEMVDINNIQETNFFKVKNNNIKNEKRIMKEASHLSSDHLLSSDSDDEELEYPKVSNEASPKFENKKTPSEGSNLSNQIEVDDESGSKLIEVNRDETEIEKDEDNEGKFSNRNESKIEDNFNDEGES